MPPLILITGATGHLGFRTLVLLLQHGYRARVTHRRPEQVNLINAASISPLAAEVEFVLVPDITAPNAYDDAIKGVDAVLHIASPIHTGLQPDQTNWRELLYDPAEKGSLRVLESALKEPRVKRVVMTSSVVVVEPKGNSIRAGPYDLIDLPDIQTMNTAPTAETAYVLSKVLSHHAATTFHTTHRRTFDLIRILPGYIQGAHDLLPSAFALRNNETSGSNEGTMTTALAKTTGCTRTTAQVLLDDVATAHILALQPSVAKNGDNLLICGNGGDSMPWSKFVPIIERQFPDAVREGILKPDARDADRLTYFDVESSERALGYKFAGAEEMVRSVVGQYLDLVRVG